MPSSRRTLLHARAAEALERQPPDTSLIPRLAHHYLAAHILGFHEQALRYSREAGELADAEPGIRRRRSVVRAGRLPPRVRPRPSAPRCCSRPPPPMSGPATSPTPATSTSVSTPSPNQRYGSPLRWGSRTPAGGPASPGTAPPTCSHRPWRNAGSTRTTRCTCKALGSLGRALALAGETVRARQVGGRAIDLARRLGDDATLLHALTTSMWHGTTPGVADLQLERTAEVRRMARDRRDFEALGSVVNFTAMVSYLVGRPDELAEAIPDGHRSVQATGQPYYRHVYCCLAHSLAFLRGDFDEAERWAEETLKQNDTFGDEMTEGPHAVQLFMIRRETGALGQVPAVLRRPRGLCRAMGPRAPRPVHRAGGRAGHQAGAAASDEPGPCIAHRRGAVAHGARLHGRGGSRDRATQTPCGRCGLASPSTAA